MSENGDQFIVDGRKPGSTCKLHSVSRSRAETIRAPDERESEHDGKWLYIEERQRFHFHIPASTLYFAHGVHFHHCAEYNTAVIIVNMIAGMDNLSLLAAQPLPIHFLPCTGWGAGINQHIICSNFISSLLGWLVIIIITVIITHLALVVFVVYEHIFSCMLVPTDCIRCIATLFLPRDSYSIYAAVSILCCLSIPVWSFFFRNTQMQFYFFFYSLGT